MAWAHQVTHPGDAPLRAIPYYPRAQDVINTVRDDISSATQQHEQKKPRVLIIGARGRCGTGAVHFCQAAGIPDERINQ